MLDGDGWPLKNKGPLSAVMIVISVACVAVVELLLLLHQMPVLSAVCSVVADRMHGSNDWQWNGLPGLAVP